MRDKILAELRKKYPGLAANVLGLLAEKLEPTTTEESQIEAAVAGLENVPIKPADYAAFLQKESDRRVTEALKKKPAEPTPTPQQKEEEPGDANSALAKQVAALMAKLEGLEKKETQKTVTEQLHAKLKEKKIPLHFAKNIDSLDELDAAIEHAEKAYTEVKQELINDGLIASNGKPGGGTGGDQGTKSKEAAAADIKAWAEKSKPAKV